MVLLFILIVNVRPLDVLFILFRIARWPSAGKKLFYWLSARVILILCRLNCVCSFPILCLDMVWNLIISVLISTLTKRCLCSTTLSIIEVSFSIKESHKFEVIIKQRCYTRLVHKGISHMPMTELEKDSESVWVKVFANKTSHFVAGWYRPPGSTSEEFQLFREQLDYIRTHHKGKKLSSAHVLGDFNFKDIDWPDRLSKSGSTLSQSEGQILIDIMNDHGLEQMVHISTREKNTLDLILTTLPGQFQDVHSPDKLSDHDIVSGTLKISIPQIKKPRRKVYLYQKGDYESMRKDTLEFAKEKYFNGHWDTRSVQENFDLLTSFIQDLADKHIPSKTSRSVSSIP